VPRAVFQGPVAVPAEEGTVDALRACSTKGRGKVLNAILDYLLAGTPVVLFSQIIQRGGGGLLDAVKEETGKGQ